MGIERISPDCDLTVYTFNEVETKYRTKYGVPPTTLLVPPESTIIAYGIVGVALTKVAIVVVPGFSIDSWMLGGERGFYWSDGA